MKIYITRINRKSENDISLFKYKGEALKVCLAFWYEQLEPRYLINQTDFKSLWFKYTSSEISICRGGEFVPEALVQVLNPYSISKFEAFLEKVWVKYKFIITIK